MKKVIARSSTAPSPKKVVRPRKPKARVDVPVADPFESVDSLNESVPAPAAPPAGEPEEFPPLADDTEQDDRGDESAFIRMLNPVGLVRPVPAMSVPDRLFDGYHFIVDEPSIPRLNGDPTVCDGQGRPGFSIQPVYAKRPETHLEAMTVWIRRMMADQQKYPSRRDLRYVWIKHMRSRLNTLQKTSGLDTIYEDKL